MKPFRSIPLNDGDILSAGEWGRRLGVKGYRKLLAILSKRSHFTPSEKDELVDFSIAYAVAMQEKAGEDLGVNHGLDIVWSGEQARTEMYETPVSNIDGFEFIGRVRSFDNKYWRVGSIRKRPAYRTNYHLDEFLTVKRLTKRRIKVPVTDAITIMAWSDNYYYTRLWSRRDAPPAVRSFSARRDFALDLAKVIRRVVRELIARGATDIQLDIPAATQYQTVDDTKLVAESFNETTKGLSANFSVHSCFPPRQGYSILFPYLLEMKKCTRFSFEYANRDTFRRGVTAEARAGYSDLSLFKEYGYQGELGVGVVHVHTDRLPHADVVRDRLLYSARAVDLDPSKIYANPDCGLRTRRPEVAYSMLSLVVAGAAKARRAIS